MPLGFLWLIDPEGDLSDEAIGAARAAADTVGMILYRERLLTELEFGRERELLRDLVADQTDLREHAAAELVGANLFAPLGPVAALVVQPLHREGQPIDEDVRLAIGTALNHVRRATSPGSDAP